MITCTVAWSFFWPFLNNSDSETAKSKDHEIVDDFGWLQLSSLTFT